MVKQRPVCLVFISNVIAARNRHTLNVIHKEAARDVTSVRFGPSFGIIIMQLFIRVSFLVFNNALR